MQDPNGPSPRKRNAAATKANILAAAKQCFSRAGYAQVGIREIACAAGVSYTMVGRYFGSKAGLLEAALADSTSMASVTAVDRANFGENLMALITADLANGDLTAMTVLAAGDPTARAIAQRVVAEHVVGPLSEWLGGPEARERAMAITMLGGGFVIYSQQLPIADSPVGPGHPLARWLVRSLQHVVDNPDCWRDCP